MKKLKELHGRKKLEYIWNYYKLPLFILFIAVYIILYTIFRSVTAKIPEIYLGFVNVSAGNTLETALTDDFLTSLDTGNPKSSVYKYQGLLLSENVSSDDIAYVQASQMKILAAIDGQLMDVVLMDQEAFDAFAQNGYLCNMEEFLSTCAPDACEALSDYLTDNIEILSDNSDEIIFHPEVQYHSEYTEYPMALELSFCQPIAKAGFRDSIYLGIIRNCARCETAGKYVEYLYQLSE